ncbi:MAG: hypothetical protein GX596_08300 [Propionibacterium sp.]|nr:hypothetical protein [Propionibacterium sp.]
MKLRAFFILLALALGMFALAAPAHADGEPPGGGASVEDGGDVGSPVPDPPAQTGTSMPRIMLTAFTTEPSSVLAGGTFRVDLTVQNMSTTSRVNNIKITLSGVEAGILPMDGAASTFIRTIRPEHSVSRDMTFRTMASMEAGPHPLTLNIEYEDGDFNQLQSQETVAIVVTHAPRADTGTVQVLPEFVSVGQDASVSFAVNNLGRTQLYNVRAALKDGQPVTGSEVFVGNVEAGASGTADLLVFAESANFEPVVVLLSYEDADGNVTMLEKSFDLVVEEYVEEFPEEFPEEPMPEAESGFTPLTLAVLGGVVLLAAVVIALVVRARRKRARATLDDDMALLDGDPLLPADPK